jgi:GGDEF domain-containing protein
VARRLEAALVEPILHQGQEIKTGVKIGIASCPEDGKTPGDLMAHAEASIRQAEARLRRIGPR